MRCIHCNEKIADKTFWCDKCGRPTGIVRREFSTVKILQSAWSEYKNESGKNYVFLIFLALLFLILMIGAYYFSVNDSLLQVSGFVKYLLDNLVFLVVIPFFTVPFAMLKRGKANHGFGGYFQALKAYPKHAILLFITILFYFILKYVCIGDPILNLVRFVMVQYWISLVLFAPVIMEDQQVSPLKAVLLSYEIGKETRWQIYFLWLILAILNLVAILPFGLGLLVTLPFSYRAITAYYRQLLDYDLIVKPLRAEVQHA